MSQTRTIIVPDDQVRKVETAIRNNGGFILVSVMVSTGFQITYCVDPR
jgi:hypothetical protein